MPSPPLLNENARPCTIVVLSALLTITRMGTFALYRHHRRVYAVWLTAIWDVSVKNLPGVSIGSNCPELQCRIRHRQVSPPCELPDVLNRTGINFR